MHSDTKTVLRAKRGNREAYGQLYDRYASLVRALAFDVTGDLDQAQDLTQEVFLRAYRNLAKLRRPDRFRAWLVGVTRRVIHEWIKKQQRDRRTRVGIPIEALAVNSDGLSVPERHIAAALAQLSPRERMAVHAFYLQNRSAAEASRLLQLSSSGFYKLLGQARRRLSEILTKGEY